MKKLSRSFIAILLVFTMLFSANSTTSFAIGEQGNNPIYFVTNVLGGFIDGLIKLLGVLAPTPDYPTVEEYFAADSENFYEGTESFIDDAADGAKWSLGFGKESVVPDNLRDGSKKYYTGGYFTQKVNGVLTTRRLLRSLLTMAQAAEQLSSLRLTVSVLQIPMFVP